MPTLASDTTRSTGFAWLPSRRLCNLAGFAACVSMMLFAVFYLQKHLGLTPCPLCVFQRIAMISLAAVFVVAAVHNPSSWGARVYSVLLGLVAGSGAGIASRHIWLQHLPADQVPSCGPSLEYLLDSFPLWETIRVVLRGTGDCAEIQWTFLGLTIPELTLIAFIALGLFGVIRNWRRDATV
ncbi:MAG: disulfide bond formation protein B [Gammaproteobacteria bacterium]|nr:disulfide bond formation protein B [Gammaproteobacteria bacterium]MCP5425442.1 disulfide bond formation protein B [Gammaproteobacteria bacterium]MCP5459791.1 disulfide bond formation protein B [Gammaproteobacteria bacterium]